MSTEFESTSNPAKALDVQQSQVTDNIEWFQLMYGDCQDGWITITYGKYFSTKWYKVTQVAEAQEMALKLSREGNNVYFGLGLRKKELDKGRGAIDDICGITCFWADIDVKADAHAETSLPQTFAEAIELVNSFPLPPSVIVKSGNGLHVYWLLEQPWYFTDKAENAKAQQTMGMFQGALIAKGVERDWILDNTSDLPRILRVPGTQNYKDPEHPVEVKILEYHPDRRYTPAQFDPYLPISESIYQQNEDGTNHGEVQLVIDNCAFIQHCKDNVANLPEKDWFAMVSNLCRCNGGKEATHQLSQSYHNYSIEETEAKIQHCLENSGPHTCQYIQDEVVFDECPSGGCGVKAPAAMATSLVFKAKLILNKLKQEIAEKPESVFNNDYLSALGVLKSRDKVEFGKVITEIKEAAGKRLNMKHLEAAVDQTLRNMDKQQQTTNIFEGLTYEFNVPEKWVVTSQGIQVWTKDGKMNVFPVPITIATRLKNLDDNTEKVELLYKRDHKWQTIRAERSTVFSKAQIIQLANYGLPVTSETAKDLVNYLAAVEAANDIPLIATVSRLGWINEREFVPFISNVVLDVDGGNGKLANAFKPSGTLNEWVELVKPMRQTPLGRFILSAGFAAPMMQRLGQRNFALHIWGDSRAGKSAVAKAALSVWGNPHQGMMTFNTTKVGLEQQVGFLSNLPLVIDEKQIVADKQNFVESLMYMLGEGKGKTRGSKNGGLASYQNWKTLAITTGEHPMSSDNSSTGVKSRVLELHSQSVVAESYGSTLHQCLESIHGTAGPEFIRRIIDYPELKEDYQTIYKRLQEEAPDLMGSHHGALALVATADMLVSQWIFGEDEDTAVKTCWAMLESIVKQLETKSEADEATRSMMHFRSWMQENGRRFSDSGSYEYGWTEEDGNTVFVNSGTFSRAMKDGGFNAIRTKADFQARKWLKPHINAKGEQVDYKSKRNPEGKTAMVIEIRLPLLA